MKLANWCWLSSTVLATYGFLVVANNETEEIKDEAAENACHVPSDGSDGKTSAYNAGDLGSIPGLGRSPGEGNGNPLQCSCLENSMDREAPQSLVGYSPWGAQGARQGRG